MKIISSFIGINRVLMLITVLLYFTIYLGLIFQIVLGAYQVIAAIILFFLWNDLEKKGKLKLLFYWLSVLLFGLFSYLEWFEFLGYEIFQMAVFPMAIAAFFTYLLEELGIENKEKI